MPIDPRIALGVNPLQLPQQDPNQGMNALARMMQLRGMQDEQQVNSLKMQEMRRGVDETNRLNSIYGSAVGPDGSIDRNKLFGGLASGNLGSRIPGIQKSLMEADEARFKMQNEAAKGYDRFRKTVGVHAANPNPSREAVAADVQGLVVSGSMDGTVAQKLLAGMPADPQQLRGYLQQAVTSQMDPKDMLLVFAPKPKQIDNGQQISFVDENPLSPTYGKPTGPAPMQRQATPGEMLTDQRTRSEGVLNRGVTIRGQDMTDRRSTSHYDPERGGIVNLQTGEFRPATQGGKPLGPKDKAMTEGQAKANLFGSRMKEADRILTSLEGKYSPSGVNVKMSAENVPVIGGIAGYAGNAMLSESGQQAEQAQRDFINAVLRRESGATIQPSEFENAKKQYFPQPNDGEKVLAQKRANRSLAIRGLEAEVPGGFRTTPTLTNPGNTGGATGSFDPSNDPLGIRNGR